MKIKSFLSKKIEKQFAQTEEIQFAQKGRFFLLCTTSWLTPIVVGNYKLLCNYNIDPLKALEDYEHIKECFVMSL